MPKSSLHLLAMMCLLAFQNARVDAADAASAIAALFDESILASNVATVCTRAALLDDADRFDALIHWVLPSETHATIRMQGDFTQTNPAPVARIDSTAEHRRGGGIVSPVFDLLDVAKRTNRLAELLDKVDAIEPNTEEQQRAVAAMRTLLHLELGQTNESVKSNDRLSNLVRISDAAKMSEMWPETLVVYRCVVRKMTAPGIDDLLAWLFAHRTQRDVPANALVWHSQIAALAGLNGHRESGASSDAAEASSELTLWIPSSLRRAQTRGQCLAAARWARVGSQVDKVTGHNDDYLFFRCPLTGDYEVECDVSASATQAMTAGTFLGNDGAGPHLWLGTFRNSASRIESQVRLSGIDEWIRHRSVVRNGVVTFSMNGLNAHVEHIGAKPDPWFAVRNWWRMHSAARDIKISGSPVIPDAVELSAATDLRGWFSYYEESVGIPGAVWEHLPEHGSSGQILGHGGVPAGTFNESLLAYQRPLDSVGSIEYEFLYELGKTEVHPALDRMVFCLKPEGVRIHWLTDGQFDRTDVSPENLSELLPRQNATLPLPFRPGKWNKLTIAVTEQRVTLLLNDQSICGCDLEASNDRIFGLFHFSDQTEARVRNVMLRGNWPLTLPEPIEQELTDHRPVQLDEDLVKLQDVFQHDLAKADVPNRFFNPVQIQPEGTVEPRRDGLFIRRPGGGPWFDIHVNLPFMVHGDFDIEMGFAEFNAVGDEHGCIMIVVQLGDEKQQQCRLLRIRNELQRQELQSSLSKIHKDGGRSCSATMTKKTEASSGRLRMARRGKTLYYLFAENDSSVFRILQTEEFSASPSVSDGLHFHTMCNGKGETSVLWKSITIRAERLTLKPDPAARPPINLYMINTDGSNLRTLAAPAKGFIQVGSGEWSSDGTKLIGDMSDGGIETSRIVIMNSDGSDMRVLGPGCMPSLSPDNKEIVFSQPSMGIMKMKADGSGRTQIDVKGWGTQWSPDGKTIAWATGNNVVLLDVKTNQRSQLLTAAQSAQIGYVYWNLGWSQNSKSIAFKARKRDASGFVVAVAGVEPATGFGVVYDGQDHINEEFTMSPDGQQVLISLKRQEASTAKLFIVDRDVPGDLKLLPGQPESWHIPGGDWSPDGKTIAFSASMPPQPVEWPLTSQDAGR
ncbi:MAG: DUF1583 domain-containing protein [Planctomycetota bacterium]|nr:DUF1583 domain-containing protein [Planctomycetota bacterium]